jgi:GDP-D-mannose 3',5'-epimerase
MVALVLGGNGFIGHHLARRLKKEGYYVVVVDIKDYEYGESDFCDKYIQGDLRIQGFCDFIFQGHYDEVYQLAADMGGCQYIFTGENDADIMDNSAQINLNVCKRLKPSQKVFYSSSACMYPKEKQSIASDYGLKESDAYPGNPDSEYGWEKLFSERLYTAYARNKGLNIRIARFHNIYGPEGVYQGGKEKAPASISRKVAEAIDAVQIWGSGEQRRSFLYIDDCIDAVRLLMKSSWTFPINIGSEESVTVKQLWETAVKVSGKSLNIEHIERPENTLGVMGRNSDNTVIRFVLKWEPKYSLREGIERTFKWINDRVAKNK